jgi:hypothetical protein
LDETKKDNGIIQRKRCNVLTFEANNYEKIVWYIDVAFVAHNNCKGNIGAVMTIGEGIFQSISKKQTVNSGSSTESELISLLNYNYKSFNGSVSKP